MKRSLLLAALLATLPVTALAHKQWLVPSSTVVAGKDVWVTVDAAVSNDLYYPDHVPMRLESITVTAPDGSTAKPLNGATLKTRSVFDVELDQQGTYRVSNLNQGLSARWGDRPAGPEAGKGAPAKPANAPAGETKPGGMGGGAPDPRGGFLRNVSPEELAAKLPKGAKNVQVSQTLARVETFITNGAPTPLKSTGTGLELVPVTHPNDLFVGEPATFALTIDGKPAAGLEVSVVRGATRYRNAQDEAKYTTDAQGRFTVSWAEAGMYWLQAGSEDDKTSVPQAKQRRLSYTATLEVLPQ